MNYKRCSERCPFACK